MNSPLRASFGAILPWMVSFLAFAPPALALAPIGTGQYFDTNGDGRCDSVLVRLDSALQGHPRFRFTLCGSAWEMDPNRMDVDTGRKIFSARATGMSWDTGRSICTEVNPGVDVLKMIDSASEKVVGVVQMGDRIPPVLKSARFAPSEGASPFDTLELQISEAITIDRSGGSLVLRTGPTYALQVPCQFLVQSSRDHIYLFMASGGSFLPTDSLRLSSFAAMDDYGNSPGALSQWVPVQQPRTTAGLRRTGSTRHAKHPGTIDALGRTSPVQSKKIHLDGSWSPDIRFTP